ncbi:MAG: hydroxymethylpyrimidine/phosphomethylpyrimidine kinase, partial [Myxococcales bacterium]|nr:hydroxymethylpyrimidine/phosphomethylpyrimidine kinase [Myxococcales bacterium]
QGVYGMAVVTALTVQNTQGISAVHPVSPRVVRAQIAGVLADLPVDAVKIGVLGGPATVRAVLGALEGWRGPLVLDPVGVAKGGWTLQSPATIRVLLQLAARATVVTPNLDEAPSFPGGVRLLKGGHGEGDVLVDRLLEDQRELARWAHPRLASVHTHGTGCVLASTLAARLALGDDLVTACGLAISYVQRQIIRSMPGLGEGRGPLWQVD